MNNEIQAIIIDCGRLLINFSLYWVNIPPRAKSAIGIPALASKFNASVIKYGIGIWDTLNKKPKIIPTVNAFDKIDFNKSNRFLLDISKGKNHKYKCILWHYAN